MNPKFREDKVTQVAALFLKLRGEKMSHLKLMKLLYLAEREALLRWRRPISFDLYVSMPHGPVLSLTYSLIIGDMKGDGFWSKYISPPSGHEVELISMPDTSSLSEAEEELIKEIFDRYGKMDRWELSDMTHELPEWQDPKGSSFPIDYKDILQGAGMTPSETASIIDEIDNIALMDEYMS